MNLYYLVWCYVGVACIVLCYVMFCEMKLSDIPMILYCMNIFEYVVLYIKHWISHCKMYDILVYNILYSINIDICREPGTLPIAFGTLGLAIW